MQRAFALADRLARGSRGLYAALAVAWAVAIFAFSAYPMGASGPKHAARAWFHNLAHAPEYGLLALWIALAARGSWRVPFVVAVLYGATDEIHQGFVPGRDGSVCDLLTDAVGAWLVVNAYMALVARDRARFARVLVSGIAACMFTALLATFLGDMFPAWTWL